MFDTAQPFTNWLEPAQNIYTVKLDKLFLS